MNRLKLIFISCLFLVVESCSNELIGQKDLEILKEVSKSDSASVEKRENTYVLKLYANTRPINANLTLSASKVAIKLYQLIHESQHNMLYNSNFEITYLDSGKMMFSKSFDLVYLSNAVLTMSRIEEAIKQLGNDGLLDSKYLYPLECREGDAFVEATGINWKSFVLSDISFAGIYPVEANLCDSIEEVEIYCYIINETGQMLWFYMKNDLDGPKFIAIAIPNEDAF